MLQASGKDVTTENPISSLVQKISNRKSDDYQSKVSDALLKRWQETRAVWSRYNISAEIMMQHYWKIIDLQLYNNIIACVVCCLLFVFLLLRSPHPPLSWILKKCVALLVGFQNRTPLSPSPQPSALSGRYSILLINPTRRSPAGSSAHLEGISRLQWSYFIDLVSI
jgi:hypothetical protein